MIRRLALAASVVVLSALVQGLGSPAAAVDPLDLQPTASWGADGPERILEPFAATVDAQGNVFILNDGSISKFSAAGRFLVRFDVMPHQTPVNIAGLAAAPSGDLYVAVHGNSTVRQFRNDGTFVRQWGSNGSGNGQFDSPFGIAVDDSGNVFVADLQLHRIQKFAANGTFLSKWGTEGSGQGQFETPYGLDVDDAGNVYVVDGGNARIQKFDNDGTFLSSMTKTWGGDLPVGVAVDSTGLVSVTTRGLGDLIVQFGADGQFLRQWHAGMRDPYVQDFKSIAVDAAGNLYVPDARDNQVLKLSPEGDHIGTTFSPTLQLGSEFQQDVAADGHGGVWVLDYNADRAVHFTADGAPQQVLSHGSWLQPWGVAVDSTGNVYLSANRSCLPPTYACLKQVLKFDPDTGGIVAAIGAASGAGQLSEPSGVAVDASNNVYVIDGHPGSGSTSQVKKFNGSGNFVTSWQIDGRVGETGPRARGIAVGPDGNILIANQVRGTIQTFSPSGTLVSELGQPGEFVPSDVAVDDQGNVYVTNDSDPRSVRVYSTSGDLRATWGSTGDDPDQFRRPSAIAVGDPGDVFTVDIGQEQYVKHWSLPLTAPNAAPTARDSSRSVRSGQPSSVLLSGFEPDGDPLSVALTRDPEHGTVTGTAPSLTYTSEPGYTGPDSIGFTVDDGRGGTDSGEVSLTVTAANTGAVSLSESPHAGGVVQTGGLPNASEPTQVYLTTHVAGMVTIAEDPSVADPDGYDVVGAQYAIEAPPNTPSHPLQLSFLFDEDLLPSGSTVEDVEIFRDGVVIAPCANSSVVVADPDPCVLSAYPDNGVGYVTVLGSRAGDWTLAVKPDNAAPVAADSSRSVRSGQASSVVLSGSDPDNDALSYSVSTDPTHGSVSGTPPNLTYTSNSGYTGPDAIGFTVDDGKGGTDTGEVSLTVTAADTGAVSVSEVAPAGGTVQTGSSPTEDEPTQAAVTTPFAGEVTITNDPSVADPDGYDVVGSQYSIEAPAATTVDPLELIFQFDLDALPSGSTVDSVAVFRDGSEIAPCSSSARRAEPDPCVTSRTASGGVGTIKVFSSHASDWTLAVKHVTPVVISTTATLPDGQVGKAYSVTLKAVGGTPAYKWSVVSGTLPAGVKLATWGTLSGTPTAGGTASFKATVTDAKGKTASRTFTVTIKPVVITSTSLPDGSIGTAYSATLKAFGGFSPYRWSIDAGSLPAGLRLNGSGSLYGTPTEAVTKTVTFRVTDARGNTATKELSVTIRPLSIITTSLPNGTVKKYYSTTLKASGGTPGYTWSIVAGTLPTGLKLGGGTISGTPTQAGTSSITVKVTDLKKRTATKDFTLTIN